MRKQLLHSLILVTGLISLIYSAENFLNGIVLNIGKKGIAVKMEFDKSISDVTVLKDNNTVFITIPNTSYSLDKSLFADYPEECPVKKVHVDENDNSVIVKFEFRNSSDMLENIKKKIKGNVFLVLLSSNPFKKYVFEYNKSLYAHKDVSVVINDIVLQQEKNGNIMLNIIADNSLKCFYSVKDKSLALKAVNVSGLGFNTHNFKTNICNGKIKYKKDKKELFLLINFNFDFDVNDIEKTATGSLIKIKADKNIGQNYSVSLVNDNNNVKTAAKNIKEEKKKAELKEESNNSLQSNEEVREKIVYINAERVNFRTTPSTDDNSNIIASLNIGTKARFVDTNKGWVRIIPNGYNTSGWVSAKFVVDSVTYALKNLETKDIATLDKKIQPQGENENFKENSSAVLVSSGSKNKKHIVFYRVYGRDPFLPLDKMEELHDNLPNVEKSTLVGILYDSEDKVALLETRNSSGEIESYALREDDPIENGRVAKIEKDKVIFLITESGFTRTFILRIKLENE